VCVAFELDLHSGGLGRTQADASDERIATLEPRIT
jgi:hypothetical protein